MNGITNALPLAGGAIGGFDLGQSAGNIVNYLAGTPPAIAADVKTWIVALVVPLVALAAHRLLSLDLDRDGKPDLTQGSTTTETTP